MDSDLIGLGASINAFAKTLTTAQVERLKTAALVSVNEARLTARMDATDRLLMKMVETITNLTETGAELLDAMRTVVERLEAVERQKCP